MIPFISFITEWRTINVQPIMDELDKKKVFSLIENAWNHVDKFTLICQTTFINPYYRLNGVKPNITIKFYVSVKDTGNLGKHFYESDISKIYLYKPLIDKFVKNNNVDLLTGIKYVIEHELSHSVDPKIHKGLDFSREKDILHSLKTVETDPLISSVISKLKMYIKTDNDLNTLRNILRLNDKEFLLGIQKLTNLKNPKLFTLYKTWVDRPDKVKKLKLNIYNDFFGEQNGNI